MMTIVKKLRDTNPFAEPENAARIMELAAFRIEELERALSREQEQSMMAGSQNSALRLQLRDAEKARRIERRGDGGDGGSNSQ